MASHEKYPMLAEGYEKLMADLKRLRDEGRIVVGARYSDKGLLVFRAASADEVREWMAGDPSMQAGTFTNTVHPFNVFYPGELAAPPRRK